MAAQSAPKVSQSTGDKVIEQSMGFGWLCGWEKIVLGLITSADRSNGTHSHGSEDRLTNGEHVDVEHEGDHNGRGMDAFNSLMGRWETDPRCLLSRSLPDLGEASS